MTETKGGKAREKYTITVAMRMEEGAMSQGTQVPLKLPHPYLVDFSWVRPKSGF